MPLIIVLVGCTNRNLFPLNRALKMRESQQLFLRLRLVSEENQQSAIQTKIGITLADFFYKLKGDSQ
jgi:hypothetical protein